MNPLALGSKAWENAGAGVPPAGEETKSPKLPTDDLVPKITAMRNNELSVRIAKVLMKRFESIPVSPEEKVGRLGEVFRHPKFLSASEPERDRIMRASSTFFYEDELAYPWDNYFGKELRPMLRGANVLDVGCFTGGRDAAWFQRYELGSLTGLEIRPVCVDAATRFAASKGIRAEYLVGLAESMPFEAGRFDAILTFETFEHVQDLAKVLSECHRVLKPGGKMFMVFPSYFHPTSHHLGLVTSCPAIQWFFSGRTLVKAYYDILQERGKEADWYNRHSRGLEPWERCNTINGTTVNRFARLVEADGWQIVMQSKKPIGSVGRGISKNKGARLLSKLFVPLTSVPILKEVFVHRITYILEKKRT